MRRARQTACIAAVVTGALLSGCTGSEDTTPPTPDAVTTTSTIPLPDTDGRLTVGLLVPSSGDSPLGEGVTNAVRQAVRVINEAGGVNGERVGLVEATEGSRAADNQRAFEQLRRRRVDVVIGPTSSLTVLDQLDTFVDAGVLTCSPTASALLLDDFPDEGLFFRTVPSDSLQAVAIADQAERTGAQDAAVVFIDDAYGRGLGEAVSAALSARAIPVDQNPIRPADDNLGDDAAAVLQDGPDVLVVLGDNAGGPRILAALGAVIGDSADIAVPDVVVNDAVRRPESQELISELPAELRTSLQGVSPTAIPRRGSEPPGVFGTNAYDCVTVAALAAEEADSDRPSDIAARMQLVSSGGSVCRRYETCKALIDAGRNIDYDGPGGVLEIDADGDPAVARFDVFTFTPKGVDEHRQMIVVRRDGQSSTVKPPT